MPALDAGASDVARVAAHALLSHEGARAYALLAKQMDVVVIKGAATAPLVWRDGERSMTDVDLLVPPRRLREARTMFASREEWSVIDTPHRRLGVRLHRAFTVKSARGVMIDVHGAVAQSARWPHDVDGIIARSVAMKLGRDEVCRACDEDCILIAALNEAKDEHALAASSSIEDIARLATSGPQPIAWGNVVARAREWRATVAVWVALDRASREHDAPIPQRVLDALRPRRASVLHAALARSASHGRRMRQAVVGPLLTDSPARFAASAAAFVAVRSIDGVLGGAEQAVASVRSFIKGAAP